MILTKVTTQISNYVLEKPVSPDWPGGYWGHWAFYTVIIIIFVLLMVMGFIWFERRALGRIQVRLGPNRAGPWGILQPVADTIKVLLKEDIVPEKGDKWVHFLAPIISFIAMLLIFAVIPFQEGAGLVPDLNIGILYVIGIGSLAIIGIFMAGWASNNKYSLVGAMRAIAQMVSYEIPMALSIVAVLLVTHSLSLQEIVKQQHIPFIFLLPLSFLIYFTGAIAEIQRTPFDLLEGESEIVAGYHIEYSGIKFAIFYLAEYGDALVVSVLVTTLFLSGWKGPLLPPFLWFLIKVWIVFFIIIWMRSSWPRVRVDQLMGFAWKFLLPLSLANLIIVAIETIFWPSFPWWLVFLNLGIAAILLTGWAGLFELRGGSRVES